jgi:hypothetical protein
MANAVITHAPGNPERPFMGEPQVARLRRKERLSMPRPATVTRLRGLTLAIGLPLMGLEGRGEGASLERHGYGTWTPRNRWIGKATTLPGLGPPVRVPMDLEA